MENVKEGNKEGIYWNWYCEKTSLKAFVTTWLPSITVTVWQNMVMPNGIYYLEQVSASCLSLSQLDRRIASLLFVWDVVNIFIGALLGGSLFISFNQIVANPGDVMDFIGKALPKSSNFFVNYVCLRAFFLIPYQLIVPHPGVLQYLFKYEALILFNYIWMQIGRKVWRC